MNKADNMKSKKSIQFDLYSIVVDVLRNLWTVVLAVLIGGMAVFVWNRSVYIPQYTSTATLLVSLKNSATYSYINLASSAEITQIFTNVFEQPTMREYACKYLDDGRFVGSISSDALVDTNIFTVSVTTGSPEMSYKELCAVLKAYPEISESVFADCIIDVLRDPNMPASPSNSVSRKSALLVAGICGAVDLLLVILLSYMRDTVKNETIFKEEIDAKLFGTVCHERKSKTIREYIKNFFRKKSEAPLVGNAKTSFAFTEEYHKIASRIEYLNRSTGAKVFLLTSCAENEGKSTASANIALTLALRKKRVLLLDMDFKKPAVHKIFSIPDEDKPDFALYLSGEISASDYNFTKYKNTSLYLGLSHKAHFNYVDWIHSERTLHTIEALRDSGMYDFIIMDTPPLTVAADITALSQIADHTLLVVRTDCVYIGELNDIILSLTDNSKNFLGCILNDVHKEFSALTQFGLNESGYYGRHNGYYGRYGKYGKYGYSSYQNITDLSDSSDKE